VFFFILVKMNPALNALDGGDPRHSNAGEGVVDVPTSVMRSQHDSSVSFEEYLYWAKVTRAEQESLPSVKHPVRNLFDRKKGGSVADSHDSPSEKEKIEDPESKEVATTDYGNVTEHEWSTASRALRTATWSAVFYLITTDILGPYSVPWAIAQMGYGPGIALYTIFGALAGL
jgi:hypothetical protein